MKTLILLFVPALLTAAQPIEKRETIQRAFPGAAKLLVDNIEGFIHVRGVPGTELRFRAEELIKAESPEALAEAQRDVKLDVSEQGSFVRLYEDGPFRTHDRGRQFYGYQVKFDYEIEVPFQTELILKSVNGGEVSVKGTAGRFDVGNVNGAVTMEQIGGSGKAHTVNGPMKISFSRNPSEASDFRTINGSVEVHFQPSLSADLQFKTLNGRVYTDFEVGSLSVPPGTLQNKDGKFIYRGSRSSVGRVGNGGPELNFETINGDVRLKTKSE